MARLADRLPENTPGEYYVDSSCIDCDTCRQIAPSVFTSQASREQSVVFRQPTSAEEAQRAAMALVACPTSSIGSLTKRGVGEAVRAFPEPIEGGVSYCGFAAESSFGASSYYVERPSGSFLVDSPRAARPLIDRLRALGGARWMLLTHKDDVADHEVYHRELGCERVIHEADAEIDAEVRLSGMDPMRLDEDLVAVPVPGHTRGSVAYLYQEMFLFTGDHLWWSEEARRLHASRSVCWYSWPRQVRSVERLLDLRFEWVLPGHGRRYRAASASAMRSEVERLLSAIRS